MNHRKSPQFLDQMIDTILKHEGGFVNDPDDPGGATNYGITIKTYRRYVNRQATPHDIKNMSKDIARKIYRQQYCYAPEIDELPEIIQPQILDMSVNAGPSRAIKLFQECIGTTADGNIGPKTIKKAKQSLNNGWHPNAYVDRRIRYYQNIARRRPSLGKFLKGWTRRANSFRVEVVEVDETVAKFVKKKLAKLKSELKKEIREEVMREVLTELVNS